MGNSISHKKVKLVWTPGKKALARMTRDTDAVVGIGVAYFRPAGTKHVYVYDTVTEAWTRFPNCPTGDTTIAIVNSLLTTIGGVADDGKQTDTLFSLIGESFGKRWVNMLPPMPTKRSCTTSVSTDDMLIVAGGIESRPTGNRTLRTVEVLNLSARQWHTAESLPEPVYNASGQVCDGRVFILRGNQTCVSSSTVISCSLPALHQSCSWRSSRAEPSPQCPVWSTVAELPVKSSTCVTIDNHLLAIGGVLAQSDPNVSERRVVTDVRLYNPNKNKWKIVSHLEIPRGDCLAAVLPDNTLMVVGGVTDESFGTGSNTVEFATVT